jgi:mannose-6-phosphate isomerase-like protein (cupin superfamily)
MMKFSFENAASAQAFKINPKDTNYFVLLFDREKDDIDNVFVVEIFTKGGATPPNEHVEAHEFFYVLEGEGKARCEDKTMPIRRGDALLPRPGSEHVIENTGPSKLYTLTVMTPNEGFAELIRSGVPVELDDEDRRVLGAQRWTTG